MAKFSLPKQPLASNLQLTRCTAISPLINTPKYFSHLCYFAGVEAWHSEASGTEAAYEKVCNPQWMQGS